VTPYYQTPDGKVTLHHGHVLDVLREMPAESVNCCVTSPPYWSLRRYDCPDQRWGDWVGQHGLEETPELYVEHTLMWLREVRRVLRKDGTLWLNLGDGYWGGKGSNGSSKARRTAEERGYSQSGGTPLMDTRPADGRHPVLKPKDAVLMPFRVALAAQAEGWWVRSVIIWAKPNPMPESVRDRPTDAHEYIFLLTKSKTYWYDADAIREPLSPLTNGFGVTERGRDGYSKDRQSYDRASFKNTYGDPPNGRNCRSVWTFPTQGFSGAKLLADYVGHDGKPYKVSPDCPIHGRLGRSRTPDTGQHDEPQGEIQPHTPGTDDCPSLVPAAEVSATYDHSSSGESNGNALTQTPRSTPDRRTSDAHPDQSDGGGNPRRTSHTSVVGGSPADNSGSPALGCADPATPHSSGSHRTAPVPATSPSCTPCEETAGHTEHTSVEPASVEHHPDSDGCNSGEDSGADAIPTDPSAQTQGRTVGKSSRSHSTCTCTIVSIDHFAVFPRELPERCIKAGCPEWVCPKCGKARVRVTETEFVKQANRLPGRKAHRGQMRDINSAEAMGFNRTETTGWTDCGCGAGFVGGVTLDPFVGSGTTCEVAYHLGRTAIGIDASAKYLDMAIERVKQGVLAL